MQLETIGDGQNKKTKKDKLHKNGDPSFSLSYNAISAQIYVYFQFNFSVTIAKITSMYFSNNVER